MSDVSNGPHIEFQKAESEEEHHKIIYEYGWRHDIGSNPSCLKLALLIVQGFNTVCNTVCHDRHVTF